MHRLASWSRRGAAAAAAAAASAVLVGSDALQKPAPTQRLFCWGHLPPAADADALRARAVERLPVDVRFWSALGVKVVSLSYGAEHAAALDDRGRVWAWGARAGPVPRQLPTRSAVASIASTDTSLIAAGARGGVVEWAALDASLADSEPGAPPAPEPVGGALASAAVTSLAAGARHALAVTRKGELYAWGEHRHGQLGIGGPIGEAAEGTAGADAASVHHAPTRVPLDGRATQAACGRDHSLVLLDDGTCVSFGDDRNLQLGLRSTSIKHMRQAETAVSSPRRVRLPTAGRIVRVAAGGGGRDGGHSAFVVADAENGGQTLWMCGHGRWGQLGHKAFSHISEPRPVALLSSFREWDEARGCAVPIEIADVGCGEKHTAALLTSGNAFVWGWNESGQLGSGGSAGSHTPAMMSSTADVRLGRFDHLAVGPRSTAVF